MPDDMETPGMTLDDFLEFMEGPSSPPDESEAGEDVDGSGSDEDEDDEGVGGSSSDEGEAEAIANLAAARLAITGKRKEYESTVRQPRPERKNINENRVEEDIINMDMGKYCCTRHCLRYV